MDHLPYLFAAYTIVWIVLFLYILSLDRRARRTEKQLEDLRRRLEKRGQTTFPGGEKVV